MCQAGNQASSANTRVTSGKTRVSNQIPQFSDGSVSNHASLEHLKSARVKYRSKAEIELPRKKVENLVNLIPKSKSIGSAEGFQIFSNSKRSRGKNDQLKVVMAADLTSPLNKALHQLKKRKMKSQRVSSEPLIKYDNIIDALSSK